jgi:hypothetical protein
MDVLNSVRSMLPEKIGYLVSGTAVSLTALTLLLPNPAKAIILVGAQQDISTATLQLDSQAATCSATLIGQKVVLTAATCLDGGGQAEVTTSDGTKYQLSNCQSVPEFKTNRNYDFELCYAAVPIPLVPERVNTDPGSLQIGGTVYLAGLGCTESGGPDTRFGKQNIGPATFVDAEISASEYYPGLVTIGSALCQGDAGGGTFASIGGALQLIAVNSRSDRDVRSLVSPTSISGFVTWAKQWSTKYAAPICGLDGDAGCAAAVGAVPVVKSPTGETKTLRMMRVLARNGDSLSSVVIRACGEDQNGFYYKALEEYYKTYSGQSVSGGSEEAGIEGNTRFGFDREISIPVCASNPTRLTKRMVRPGEIAWSIWQGIKDQPKAQGLVWEKFRRDGDKDMPSLDSSYFVDVLIALNKDNKDFKIARLPEGRNILIPLAPLVARAKTGTQAVQYMSAISSDNSLPYPIFAVNNAVDPSCDQNTRGPEYPYELRALLDVLRKNRQGRTTQPVLTQVLVVDSGVAGMPGNPFFSEDLLSAAGKTKRIAPDFPSSMEGYNHGTQVAALVLGGPVFARFQGLGFPRITLSILPIYSRYKSQQVRAVNNWIGQITDAAKNNAKIVNLSLEVRGQLETTSIFSQSDLLFVVAAGNDRAKLLKTEIYPAKLGGLSRVNIVTVAAVVSSKSDAGAIEVKTTDFSNRGSKWVDIGAPGCGVPSVALEEDTWKEVSPDGTSFAAPLVSFTAAMIRSEARLNGLTPLEIKRRLLASSDLYPSEESNIEDGRVLNVVKAVSMYQDIIQTKDGSILSGALKFVDANGSLGPDDPLPFTCNGQQLDVSVKKLLKLWPDYRTPSLAKIYMLGGDQDVLLREECTLSAGLTIQLTDGPKLRSFKPEELRDVIPRLF